jgi:diguanylate cyclase (GGDEF)-like protein
MIGNKFVQTLQGRMRGLIIFSIAIVLLVGSFGGWKIRQFHYANIDIQKSSDRLQQNLQQNFNASRLIGNIHSNLRLYMQSADDSVLSSIRNDIKTLRNTLPEGLHSELVHLQKIIDTLSVRMNSMHENNDKIPLAEQAIATAMGLILQNFPRELAQEILPHASKARGMHQQIYISSIISGQASKIKSGQRKVTVILTEVEQQLEKISKRLTASQQEVISKLQDAFYWLDEASSTVSAIRLTTMKTEQEIISAVDSLKNAIAEDSLYKNKTSFVLTQKGMEMATQNIIILVVILIFLAMLFTVTSMIISRHMVVPLVDFVSLLRNLGRMMAGQRKSVSSDDAHMQQLSSFIKERRDEIGEVALAIKDMLTNMQTISFFRKTIEADESTKEIYERLARIFIRTLGLDQFVIYEKLRSQVSMEHVYCHPPELKDEVPEFAMANNCRAKRTGAIVTSYDDPDICKIYPFQDCLDHYCIPMIVGGHVIGVVQFFFPKNMSREEQSQARDRIFEAQNFIAETLPVLQSKHLAGELEEMATKDQLTGLFNRRYLETSLDQLVAGVKRRGTTMGILMCDLDYFKQVNDNYGHDAGDAVLSQLALVLQNSVRNADLVIRFGGEEFIILLMDCEDGKATDIAEKIRQDVENYKFQAVGKTIQKTTSIGVAEYPTSENQGIWEAIKFADVALYKAKDNGRNRVEVFDAAMWEGVSY